MNIGPKEVRSFVGQQWPEPFFFFPFLLHSEGIVLQMGDDLGHQSVSGVGLLSSNDSQSGDVWTFLTIPIIQWLAYVLIMWPFWFWFT